MSMFCANCRSSTNTVKRCSCRNVSYCNRECQVAHWKIHKSMCSYHAATELLEIFDTDRSKLLSFLEKHGNWFKLKLIIKEIEHRYPDNIRVWHRLMSASSNCKNRIFELPTNELCTALIKMFSHLKVEEVIEVGAGSGLLTARLKQCGYTGKLRATDSGTWEAIHPVFDHVEKISVEELERPARDTSMNVMFCWMHKEMEPSVRKMITKLNPERLWFIGELMVTGGGCGSMEFHEWLCRERGYQSYVIPVLQIASTEYYTKNPYQRTEDPVTNSCITFYNRVKSERSMTDSGWKEVIGKEYYARVINWREDILNSLYDKETMRSSKDIESSSLRKEEKRAIVPKKKKKRIIPKH